MKLLSLFGKMFGTKKQFVSYQYKIVAGVGSLPISCAALRNQGFFIKQGDIIVNQDLLDMCEASGDKNVLLAILAHESYHLIKTEEHYVLINKTHSTGDQSFQQQAEFEADDYSVSLGYPMKKALVLLHNAYLVGGLGDAGLDLLNERIARLV